jgi:hypothetical protein
VRLGRVLIEVDDHQLFLALARAEAAPELLQEDDGRFGRAEH